MSWHYDRQRRRDSEEARALKEQGKALRMKTARKLFEDSLTLEEISRRARCGSDTLVKWIRDGGWKRSDT